MHSKYKKIEQVVSRLNMPSYRYEQILTSIFTQRISEYTQMYTLPKQLRCALANEMGNSVCLVRPVSVKAAKQAGKVLLALPDGNRTEAVALRYERGWESFCISSQCGCGFACRFCATGTIGLKRNLTAEEITDQLLYFYLNGHGLNSISFMGMGEALANPHIFDAITLLTDTRLFGLSQRRITISTIGIVPGIQKLTRHFPQVNLAFSLHSPFEEQRSELMPVNKKFPLYGVMNALDGHIQATGRKIFIAYTLLYHVNDSPNHAKAVANLLQSRGSWGRLYHVDLIPYNPTDKTTKEYTPSGRYRIRQFYEILKAEGISVTVRAQFGSDINAACGQLFGGE